MSLPDLKALKKLADACRKSGIKHYKSADMEFTLTDYAPESNYKKKQAASEPQELAPEETLTQDQLLFWSSVDTTEKTEQ